MSLPKAKSLSIELVRQFFDDVEAKDMTAIVANFCKDADFIDPHYPKAHMHGEQEILEGLTWGFKNIKELSFTIVHYFEREDGKSVAVEVTTDHVLPNGKPLNAQQMFVFELSGKGKIKRLQAYEPYGPHGMVNIMLVVTRFFWRFTH